MYTWLNCFTMNTITVIDTKQNLMLPMQVIVILLLAFSVQSAMTITSVPDKLCVNDAQYSNMTCHEKNTKPLS